MKQLHQGIVWSHQKVTDPFPSHTIHILRLDGMLVSHIRHSFPCLGFGFGKSVQDGPPFALLWIETPRDLTQPGQIYGWDRNINPFPSRQSTSKKQGAIFFTHQNLALIKIKNPVLLHGPSLHFPWAAPSQPRRILQAAHLQALSSPRWGAGLLVRWNGMANLWFQSCCWWMAAQQKRYAFSPSAKKAEHHWEQRVEGWKEHLLNRTLLLKASLRFESNSSSFNKTLLFQTISSFFNLTLPFQFSSSCLNVSF